MPPNPIACGTRFAEKEALRQLVRDALRALPTGERRTASAEACRHLQESKVWAEARSVLLFVSLEDELDVMPVIRSGLATGKSVSLPRFDKDSASYTPARIGELSDLAPGRFGIIEPGLQCPETPLNHLDFILVPGVAFDARGRRLGRGLGHYDRLLRENRALKCGICLEQQVVGEVPEQSHDIRVDLVLTPRGWLQIEPRS